MSRFPSEFRVDPPLPSNHAARMDAALQSLEGLAMGDAFGEQFFRPGAEQAIARRETFEQPWRFTDDTVMALSIVDVLNRRGGIVQDDLAACFAVRFVREPDRGYGPTAIGILGKIAGGLPWRHAAGGAFGGQGSQGNGGAMRAGPIGAYFADDFTAAAEHARRSAEITHAHPEGQAGAIAVAVAAAAARRLFDTGSDAAHDDNTALLTLEQGGTGVRARFRSSNSGAENTILDAAIEHTPAGETREGLLVACRRLGDATTILAASALGSGSRAVSSDTVPFAIWAAARFVGSFEEALWQTVSALGDRDTTCAIVGSIVGAALGTSAIPRAWLAAREKVVV